MMLSCNEEVLNEGRNLAMSFFLPSGELIMVRGIVRAVIPAKGGNGERYAVEFLEVGFQYKRAIRNFVAAATRMDGQIIS